MKAKSINRREFLKTSAVVNAGLLISFCVPVGIRRFTILSEPKTVFTPNAFLRVGVDDQIQVILSKVEMGQGIWTTLPMLIAEELDCDWNKIVVEHSPVDKAYNHVFIPFQATVGSSSTTSEFDRYRLAGATARVMLIQAAAQKLGVKPASCRTENGFVIAGNQKIRYGELVLEASQLPVPSVSLRPPSEWKYIGKSQKRLDSPAKINGKAQFGMDIQFPGLLTAVVAHSPVFGGKVKAVDSTKTKAIPGVQAVVQIPSGVAVLADNFWNAKRGRDVLRIDWDLGPHQSVETNQLIDQYRQLAKTKGKSAQIKGDVDSAFPKAAQLIETEYVLPYLAHAPMEPLNCTVRIGQDGCEIWTGTQLPTLDQAAAAKVLNIKPELVAIKTPFLGGGFGRRGSFNSDWVVEAVQIAKASGKAIKLVWSREDDIQGGYYRPLYLHQARIGIGTDGFPVSWQHRIVGQAVFSDTTVSGHLEVDDSSVEGVKGSPYLESVPDHSVELHTTVVGVPVLPWRSVGFSHTIFVIESLIDELAFLAKKDPVAYRRSLLKNQPRYLATLNLATEKAGWSTPPVTGQFRGVAVSERGGSYVAHVIEISIVNQQIQVHRVVSAIDCGLAVNPDGVRAQVESSVVFGLTTALHSEITVEKGQVVQHNFHDYRLLRMAEMPLIEVHIVDSSEKMGGVGEPAVPSVMPALANAVFAATGNRIRRLPIRLADPSHR